VRGRLPVHQYLREILRQTNVTASDAYGNLATKYTGTVHFTSSDGSATLPADYTFRPRLRHALL